MPPEAARGAGAPGSWGSVRVVLGRELGAYFDSAIAYVYAAAFLLLSGSVFMNAFFLEGLVDMSEWFRNLPWLLVVFVPAITMRTWSEEHAQGTFELLMTLPMRAGAVVLGKFLAAGAFYLVVLAGSLPIVGMLLWLGQPDLGSILASYLGAALLGGFFLAFGMLVSGLTRDQIVAFAVASFASALFVLTGHERVVEVLDGLAPELQAGTWLYESVSVLPRYESFCRGLVSAGDLGFFLLFGALFLVVNRSTLGLRR